MAHTATTAQVPSTPDRSTSIVETLKANQAAAEAAGLGGPAMDAFYAEVLHIVSEAPDPEATFGAVAQLLSRERGTSKDAACPLYRDCVAVGPHYDHHSMILRVADGRDDLIDAGMVALSSEGGGDNHAVVTLRNAEFSDAVSLRTKTAELRNFLDQVEVLADRVFADQQGRP